MKRVVLLICFILPTLLISAEDSYEKPIPAYSVGSNAKFYAYTFDDAYYLILSFMDSEKYHLISNCVIKFQLNDGSVLRLDGIDSSGQTSSASVLVGSVIVGGSSNYHYVLIPISWDKIEKIKDGVDKVAINTIPVVYERDSWSGKKKFGINLYNAFKDLKKEFEP